MNQPSSRESQAPQIPTPVNEATPVDVALSITKQRLEEAIRDLREFGQAQVIPSIYRALSVGDYAKALDIAHNSVPVGQDTTLRSLSLLYIYLKRFEDHAKIVAQESTRGEWIIWRGVKSLFRDFSKNRSFGKTVATIEEYASGEIELLLHVANQYKLRISDPTTYPDALYDMLWIYLQLHTIVVEQFRDLQTSIAHDAREVLKTELTELMVRGQGDMSDKDIARTSMFLAKILGGQALQVRNTTDFSIQSTLSGVGFAGPQKLRIEKMLAYWQAQS